jgi:hypothetical protein
VRAYEELWRQQAAECRPGAPRIAGGPPCYPAPEVSFAAYPTQWLDSDSLVQAVPEADLRGVLAVPLCNYAGRRVVDEATLRAVLAAAVAPRALGELAEVMRARSARDGMARATLAWLLKYGLLRGL